MTQGAVEQPDEKRMDGAKRSKASAARTQILAEIRTSAYAAHGIKLLSGEATSCDSGPRL
ncbi:MAG: hypothetical protein BGO16_14400 [Nitrobacter sp. 62-23]|nr:MAG: hypothetical protein BGO16_14400 [Nitrobacter sp. 62-23]